MSMKIMLDAGHHGNYNRSPVLESYYESHSMWKLHSNACDTESVDRVEVYCPIPQRDKSGNGLLLAQALALAVARCMGVEKGVAKMKESKVYKGTEYYGVMRGACKAGVPLYFILEHSFHTNLRAAKWLSDEENLRKLAKEEALVFCRFFTIFREGDVNLDGKVNAEDAAALKQAVLKQATLTEEQKKTADMNADGLVNGLDYLILKTLLAD